jgi:DNA sulfur modification protein DndB
MGDWIYYVTSLRFDEVRDLVKPTTEIHKNRALSDMIQRVLKGKRASEIAHYLREQEERLFNAIVLGVYGGTPRWAPLRVTSAPNSLLPKLSDDQETELEKSVGMLCLDGSESLFAIDGQHRVEGIKKAIKEVSHLKSEEICAIFVGHQESQAGIKRTRRLFTTLNKSAQRVTTAEIVALDEDDGFALTARRMVDEYKPFARKGLVATGGSSALSQADNRAITSIVGLYEMAQDLFPVLGQGSTTKRDFNRARPNDDDLDHAYTRFSHYWEVLAIAVRQVREVLLDDVHDAGYYRQESKNHLLFRPVGQRAFCSAVALLVSRGAKLDNAIGRLAEVDMLLAHKTWHYVLWDPVESRMITKNRRLAQSVLLRQIKEKAATPKDDQKLASFLATRRG